MSLHLVEIALLGCQLAEFSSDMFPVLFVAHVSMYASELVTRDHVGPEQVLRRLCPQVRVESRTASGQGGITCIGLGQGGITGSACQPPRSCFFYSSGMKGTCNSAC